MKLTWFAGTTLRIHIGGQILVTDPQRAPGFVDRTELVAGADQVFVLVDNHELPPIGALRWRPRVPQRMIDEADARPPVSIGSIGKGAVLVDALGEPPLMLMWDAEMPPLGRWVSDAVMVLFGASDDLTAMASALLEIAPPRLLALAADEATIDVVIDRLRQHLDSTALVSLEPGMAREV